jgi:SAM-dependent methyltransferase
VAELRREGAHVDVTVTRVDQPRVGDAFGELMRAALAEETGIGPRPTIGSRQPRPVIELVERDDGFLQGAPAARYLSAPHDWPPFDHRAVDLARGRVLDIGVGAGRIALELQRRGLAVTGLDTSPGCVAVARTRGVREVVCSTVDNHVGSYDTFLLLGNNVGLLESRQRAPGFLAALAALAAPGARIVGQGTDPYGGTDEAHLAYHERNRRRGRMGGQLMVRVRYRDVATEWFDYLLCSPSELETLVAGTGWRIEAIDDADAPLYLAILVRAAAAPARR